MALEGDIITFTITNKRGYYSTFYWGVEELEGTITDSDFDDSQYRAPGINYLSSSSPQVKLYPGESQTISLQLKNDRLIEEPEKFRIFSTTTIYGGDRTTEATISIQDVDTPLISISQSKKYEKLGDSYLNLAVAPGESKRLTQENFKFTATSIDDIFSVTPFSAILRLKEGNTALESNHLVLATRNSEGRFQEETTYEQLPTFTDYRFSATTNTTVDSKKNLYSIHRYYGYKDDKLLLLKHNRKGKEVFQVPLSSRSQAIAVDSKNGLLISSSNFNNDKITIERRDVRTGKQLWTSEPFFCGFPNRSCGSFDTSFRSIQPLDDGSFLTSASGFFDLDGPSGHSSSHVAKVSLKDGRLQALIMVDENGDYSNHEFFTKDDQIFFRTANGAYEIGVNAKPTKTLQLPTASTPESVNKNKLTHRLTKPEQFTKRFADKITNFNPKKDTLSISKSEFDIGQQIKFATSKNKRALKALAKQETDFIYDQKKGGLYYNENGPSPGFGDGGLIAILKGAPDISSEHIQSI